MFKDMIDFFEKRTRGHIKRVETSCRILSDLFDEDKAKILIDRGINHDASKFGLDEYNDYVCLTWNLNVDSTFPVPDTFGKAQKHHYSNNRHHPEFYNNILEMTDLDLAEMVADIFAMSEEFNDSPIEYLNNNHFKKYSFSKEQLNNIIKYLEKLYLKVNS